jgi:hypothetical protein
MVFLRFSFLYFIYIYIYFFFVLNEWVCYQQTTDLAHLTEISTWKEANSGQAAPFDQQSQCPGTRVRFEEGHSEQRKV